MRPPCQQVTELPPAAHLPASYRAATCSSSASKLPSCHLQLICQQVLVTTNKYLDNPLQPTYQQVLHPPLATPIPASTLSATCGPPTSTHSIGHLRHICQQVPQQPLAALPASTSATSKYLSHQQVPQLPASTSSATSKYISYQQVPHQLPASTSATSKYLIYQQVPHLPASTSTKQEE